MKMKTQFDFQLPNVAYKLFDFHFDFDSTIRFSMETAPNLISKVMATKVTIYFSTGVSIKFILNDYRLKIFLKTF